MIVTYTWLKEFVDFDLAPEALADLLTMLGLEVEGIRTVGEGLDDVVVAEVEERTQHPNADKLSLCRVFDGRERLSVVCGAPNVAAGQKVALARIGSVLPGDFRIKKSKIRGEESFGMLCSERELGLSEESAGIMVLPAESVPGVPLMEALELKDTIFEIGLTPNRADCLSVVGIAREIAAKLGKSIHCPGHTPDESGRPVAEVAAVRVDDPQLCPRYMARHIEGCTIAPSPEWLVRRLKEVGLRSINNVVDVTNYVLIEYGHPLHAFDFDRLAGGSIIVRRAEEGSSFRTLDGQERPLNRHDLMICDAEKPVALAGIMGGENSEIMPDTRNILLESAYFSPTGIRRSSKRLGLHTESSHRFERGADIEMLPRALDRAAALIAELAGGTVARGKIDVYPEKVSPRKITFRVEKAGEILGLPLSQQEAEEILVNLEFEVEPVQPGLLRVTVPTFRVDIEREIDLVEEVARLKGYESIPPTMPNARILSERPTLHQSVEKKLRDLLVAEGFSEVINFSFFATDQLERIFLSPDDPRRSAIALCNPLSDDQGVMRTTLLPGLLQTAARNCSYRLLDLRLFELRRVYLPREGEELPAEPVIAAGIMTGRREPEGWGQETAPVDFFDAKGALETVFEGLQLRKVAFVSPAPDPFYHPGKSCTISAGGEAIGTLGEIHPDVQAAFGLDQPLFYFELSLERILRRCGGSVKIAPPSRFPEVVRDVALLVAEDVAAADILGAIGAVRVQEVEAVELFDLYRGAGIPEGKKSMAIRIRYRSSERTLTDDEVTSLHRKIIEVVGKRFEITIR